MEFKNIALTQRVYNRPYDSILPSRPELSQAGKTVIITGRSQDKLDSAVDGLSQELKTINPKSETKFEGRLCQISDSDSIDTLFKGLTGDGIAVDVLVLSAALAVAGKITDQSWERVWEQFLVNVRATHQFRDLFEKQEAVSSSPRSIIHVSTSAIHHFTNGMDMGAYTLTKNSSALLLQKVAEETAPSQTQIINFHPGAILSLQAKEYGMTPESANWDHEDHPGSFAVWAASPEAAFLHGRFVWAAWDVNELQSGPLREKLDNDSSFLKISVNGL